MPPAPPRLADIIREFGPRLSPERLTGEQRRALRDLPACRTAALGGRVLGCASCGPVQVRYNSCRNRHRPRCRAGQRAAWLAREGGRLLPVAYHHVVFTLPPAVAGLARRHPATVYGLLFASAGGAVRRVAADPRHLGAQVGLLLVPHTWGQRLQHHPHVHGLVTAGGLSCDARGEVEASPRWVGCRPGFFLPVRVLSRAYRGQFLDGLRAAYRAGKLTGFADGRAFAGWLAGLRRREWVVYAQPPAAGPVVVRKYLARYVHRVALAESRLVRVGEAGVTFTWKDYAAGGRVREQTLPGEEFLRRWLRHVLPRGFVKVRHYGLLANRHRGRRLALCRRLLWPAAASPRPAVEARPAAGPERCPRCGGRVAVVAEWPRGSAVPPAACTAAALDST